jgi:hypothetical protein
LGFEPPPETFLKHERSSVGSTGFSRYRRPSRPSLPSTSGYLIAAGAAAAALFFVLWWMLLSGGDEAPWVPAGLAASVVMLVAVSAREVVMRRAWSRYLLDHNRYEEHVRVPLKKASRNAGLRSPTVHASVLRTLQRQSAEADAQGALPEAHLEAYRLCQDYLARSDQALLAPGLHTESLLALRTGQERVRALQKHHLLNWAKGASRALTREAQQRARLSEKTETAMRALDCIDSALKIYPDDAELNESGNAVREFMVSVKVAHWVELAERSAFKGHYRRAIDRYRDALFYLMRGSVDETLRAATAEKIGREIELLRAKLKTDRDTKKGRDQKRPNAEEHRRNAGTSMPKV